MSIGNPIHNSKVWQLYKEIIMGKRKRNSLSICNTEVKESIIKIDMGSLPKGKDTVASCFLTNLGSDSLLIYDIVTTCGCTRPIWEKMPIPPGKKSEIKITIAPIELGYFRKRLSVQCNIPQQEVQIFVSGIVR